MISGKTLEDVSEADPKKSSRQKKLDQIRLREALEAEELRDSAGETDAEGNTNRCSRP